VASLTYSSCESQDEVAQNECVVYKWDVTAIALRKGDTNSWLL
jgi:hypothetical protein